MPDLPISRPAESPDDPGSAFEAAGLTAGRRDQILEEMARVVIRRRLETPAIFFLEMHKPLTALASAALAFSQPTLGVFFGFRRLAEWAALLDDRENLDRLIVRIERLSADAGYSAGQGEPESCMNRGGKGTQSLSE